MNNNCTCGSVPQIWRLSGVSRTMRCAILNPDKTPCDLSGYEVAVSVSRDDSDFAFTPQFVIEGEGNNIVKFAWPADKQGVGDYTIEITATDGSGNVDRVNWHGPTGIRLVEFSFEVKGEDTLGVTSESNIGLAGTYTMNGTGMSAYDEWIAEGHTGTPEDFIIWLRQPATDAAAAAEAQMGQIQERADEDHRVAGNDHTQAGSDHDRAAEDHRIAGEDHTTASGDHNTATEDHRIAGEDHSTASSDHETAQSDHGIAEDDHTRAERDHGNASDDHARAGQDHETAGNDHTRAGEDHSTATEDHRIAGEDHTQAGNDHSRANDDHAAALLINAGLFGIYVDEGFIHIVTNAENGTLESASVDGDGMLHMEFNV